MLGMVTVDIFGTCVGREGGADRRNGFGPANILFYLPRRHPGREECAGQPWKITQLLKPWNFHTPGETLGETWGHYLPLVKLGATTYPW